MKSGPFLGETQSSHLWTLPTWKATAFSLPCRLSRWSDEDYHDIPLDISPESPAAGDAFAEIPAALVSRETLLYVGLSEAKATELWDRWINWPNTTCGPSRHGIDPDDGRLQVTFDDMIIGSLENQADRAGLDDEQWRACLDACGISADLQDAIMDPIFKYLRLCESCLWWVKDTIRMRYAGLKDIQSSSREREEELRRRQMLMLMPMASPSRPGPGQHDQQDGRQQQQQQQNTPKPGWLWSQVLHYGMSFFYEEVSFNVFKTVDRGRIPGLLDDETDALARVETLLTEPPSDFSGTRALYYFIDSREVAEYQAAYAKRRANCGESIAIVCLHLPEAAMDGLALRPCDVVCLGRTTVNVMWQDLVRRCRTQRPLLSDLRRTQRAAVLVMGAVSRMEEEDWHTADDISARPDVHRKSWLHAGIAGESSISEITQYAFSGDEEGGRDFLVEHCAQSFRLSPFTQPQFEAWREEHREIPDTTPGVLNIRWDSNTRTLTIEEE
ncbi:hypothetical protein QBC46DRAFT_455040 [Diplogelasinospora grovesii]|uniref:Uncharacterized protein n=1 Tax=Diplogelasinospora grovesii TaxID=303347 RepID=A0AAN6NIG9_9PEZI|nr:hypothetical protein QBC46DRAFT_455040 [Diplogelasinospora grovesii]